MNNMIVGIIGIIFACFLFFLSPQEKNMFGYKSPQQGINKNAWKWSNKCFGILVFIGAVIYLLSTIIFHTLNLELYNTLLNKIGLVYIFACIIITEAYVFIRSKKNA